MLKFYIKVTELRIAEGLAIRYLWCNNAETKTFASLDFKRLEGEEWFKSHILIWFRKPAGNNVLHV